MNEWGNENSNVHFPRGPLPGSSGNTVCREEGSGGVRMCTEKEERSKLYLLERYYWWSGSPQCPWRHHAKRRDIFRQLSVMGEHERSGNTYFGETVMHYGSLISVPSFTETVPIPCVSKWSLLIWSHTFSPVLCMPQSPTSQSSPSLTSHILCGHRWGLLL